MNKATKRVTTFAQRVLEKMEAFMATEGNRVVVRALSRRSPGQTLSCAETGRFRGIFFTRKPFLVFLPDQVRLHCYEERVICIESISAA